MIARTSRSLLLAMIVVTAAGCSYTQLSPSPYTDVEPADPDVPRTYSEGEFGEITEYGEWIHTASFGWVWQPWVRTGWQPFVHGHWVWSEWGWTWISYEPFGWAVYHYGYWVFDTIWGWIWVPGYEWYPNRVQWAVWGDYICWAPLTPPGVYYGDPWGSPLDNIWVVCSPEYFVHENIASYARRGYRPDAPGLQTRVKYAPPAVERISQRTRTTVRPQPIKMQKRVVGDHEIQRMVLPPHQQSTVDRYQRRVEKRITPQPPPPRRDPDASRPKTQPEQRTKEPEEQKSNRSKSNPSKSDSKGEGKSSGRQKDRGKD